MLMPSQNPKLPARPVRLIVAGLALALTVSGCAQLKGGRVMSSIQC
jgi:hypothetical protein